MSRSLVEPRLTLDDLFGAERRPDGSGEAVDYSELDASIRKNMEAAIRAAMGRANARPISDAEVVASRNVRIESQGRSRHDTGADGRRDVRLCFVISMPRCVPIEGGITADGRRTFRLDGLKFRVLDRPGLRPYLGAALHALAAMSYVSGAAVLEAIAEARREAEDQSRSAIDQHLGQAKFDALIVLSDATATIVIDTTLPLSLLPQVMTAGGQCALHVCRI